MQNQIIFPVQNEKYWDEYFQDKANYNYYESIPADDLDERLTTPKKLAELGTKKYQLIYENGPMPNLVIISTKLKAEYDREPKPYTLQDLIDQSAIWSSGFFHLRHKTFTEAEFQHRLKCNKRLKELFDLYLDKEEKTEHAK